MKIKHKKYIYFILAFLFITTGCSKDYLDINVDPNNPQAVNENLLLPRAQQYAAFSLGFSRGTVEIGLSEVLGVYTHQMTLRESPDQYGATGTEFNIQGAWKSFYNNSLPDLNAIIKQGTEKDNRIYVGIAKILKAYLFSQFVDTFGDIPFSQAGKFSEGIVYAKFDNDEEIYPQLIVMLDEGIADLNSQSRNALKPGTDDIIYNGNVTNWVKTANTIKLKLYTQLRLVQNVAPEVTALLADPAKLISSTSESFLYNFGSTITPDDRNPAFNDYVATQKSRYISPWFYEIMKGNNPRIFTGLVDPRIPYYWYEQIEDNAATSQPTEYRDMGFASILFGSIGPNRDHSSDDFMTVFGLYPAGGQFDDNSGTPVTGTSGTGAAPFKFLTFADRLYLEAELMQTGIVPGDARAKLNEALSASFELVDFVANKAKLASQTVPALVGTDSVSTYITNVLGQYDAKDAAGKLEIVMTQKWIAGFGSAVDSYTDYRRTGYPILFDPRNTTQAPNGFVQPPVEGNPTLEGNQPAVQVQLTRDFPLSLPWSQDEINVNINAPDQKQPSSYRVFWDKD